MQAGEITPNHEDLFEAIDQLREMIDDAEYRGNFEAASALLDALRTLLKRLDALPINGQVPSAGKTSARVAFN